MFQLIIINGDEDFLKNRAALDCVSASLIESVSYFDLPDDLDRYLFESQTCSFDLRPRAYVLNNVSEIPELPFHEQDLLIVVAGKKSLSDKRSKLVLNFPKLKAYDDNNEVVYWIEKEGEQRNIDLSNVSVHLFVSCGNCLQKLSSEIEKLADFSVESSTVTHEIVYKIVGFSAELTPKQIVDAVCRGRTGLSVSLLSLLQEHGDESGWVISYMQHYLTQMLKMKLMSQNNKKEDQIIASLGVSPFVYKRFLCDQMKIWSVKSLRESLEFFCDLEVLHKRGVPAATLLELEIIRLSEEARNVC